MAQVTDGVRGLFERARSYDLFQGLVGVERYRRTIARDYIRSEPGMRVLDIGSGTSGILAHLPGVDYFGFDLNPAYVQAAEERFGARGRFVCADVNDAPAEAAGPFDRILAFGLLHHLEDDEVTSLMALARRRMAPEGFLVTVDPCNLAGQPFAARLLIGWDRGRNVRQESGYAKLAASAFPVVESRIREDLLRVPYTHTVLRCALTRSER